MPALSLRDIPQTTTPSKRKARVRMMAVGDKSCLLRMMNMVGDKSNLVQRLRRHDLVLSSQSISHPNDDHIVLDVVGTWPTSTSSGCSGFRTESRLASSRQQVEAHHARCPGFSRCASIHWGAAGFSYDVSPCRYLQ